METEAAASNSEFVLTSSPYASRKELSEADSLGDPTSLLEDSDEEDEAGEVEAELDVGPEIKESQDERQISIADSEDDTPVGDGNKEGSDSADRETSTEDREDDEAGGKRIKIDALTSPRASPRIRLISESAKEVHLPAGPPKTRIVVKDCAYATYRAVLYWVRSHY